MFPLAFVELVLLLHRCHSKFSRTGLRKFPRLLVSRREDFAFGDRVMSNVDGSGWEDSDEDRGLSFRVEVRRLGIRHEHRQRDALHNVSGLSAIAMDHTDPLYQMESSPSSALRYSSNAKNSSPTSRLTSCGFVREE